MPSASLRSWQAGRIPRLAGSESQCGFAETDRAAKDAAALAATSAASVLGAPPAVIAAAAAATGVAREAEGHLEECLRGLVMHLSAHFQGFARDLYTECSQACAAAVLAPPGMSATMQRQFLAQLALEKGNPTNENLVKDFSRFGLDLSFTAPHVADRVANGPRLTHLGQLQAWRNRAVHQGTSPLGGGVPQALTLAIIQAWRSSCDGLATSLDDIMYNQLSAVLGKAPW